MKYFKIMVDGVTVFCIETDKNLHETLEKLSIKNIEKIIEIDKEEAYEWYDVTNM